MWFAQLVQALDCTKGMLVDREPMVVITYYERVNRFEFRQHQVQQPQMMHGAQGIRCVWRRQNLAQMLPGVAPLRHAPIDRAIRLLNSMFRCCAQLEAVSSHETEHLEQEIGILQPSWLLQQDESVDNREVGVRQARSPTLKFPIQGRARRGDLLQ